MYGCYRDNFDASGFNIARGAVAGKANVDARSDVTIGTSATDFNDTGTISYPANPTLVYAKSSSADDSPAGSGAGKVTVTGLIENDKGEWVLSKETITLNGVGEVNSTKTKWVRFVSAETDKIAVGDIIIAFAGATYIQVSAGSRKSQMSGYTIPSNCVGYLMSVDGAPLDGTASVIPVEIVMTKDGVTWTEATVPFQNGDGFSQNAFKTPIKLAAKTDVKLRAKAASADTRVVATLYIIVESSGGLDAIVPVEVN